MNVNNNTSLAIMQTSQVDASEKVANAKRAISEKDDAALNAAAMEFEAMFVTQMLRPMFEGIKPDPRFGGSKGEEIFNGFMLDEYGKMIAETGQLGIADSIKAEMIRMQEEANGQGIR